MGKANITDMLLYKGYCFESNKVMTDQEKIHAALLHQINPRNLIVLNDKNGNYVSNKYYPGKKTVWRTKDAIIRYKSPEEILEKNPDCCKVSYDKTISGKHAGTSVEPLREIGLYAGHVYTRYKIDYVDIDGVKKEGEIIMNGLISNCGKYNYPT